MRSLWPIKQFIEGARAPRGLQLLTAFLSDAEGMQKVTAVALCRARLSHSALIFRLRRPVDAAATIEKELATVETKNATGTSVDCHVLREH